MDIIGILKQMSNIIINGEPYISLKKVEFVIKQVYGEDEKAEKNIPHWHRFEDICMKHDDEGHCITTEPMLFEGFMGYHIICEDTMVNRNFLCIPISELKKLPKDE